MAAECFFALALVLAASTVLVDKIPGSPNDDSVAIGFIVCAAGSAIVSLVLLVVRLVG